MLIEGQIKREDLPGLLKTSPEYRQKVVPGEHVKVQVPISVDVHITEDIFFDALKKSGTYWEIIKPKMDIGGFIFDSLKEPEEFLKWFYTNKEEATPQDFFDKLMEVIRSSDSGDEKQ